MNKIFFGIIMLVGIFLMSVAGKIDSVSTKCTDISFRNSLRGIIVISSLLFAFSLSYFICTWNCGACKVGKMSLLVMSSLILTFGIVLIVLGSIMKGAAKKDKCVEAEKLSWTIISSGIFMVVGSVGYIAFASRKKAVAVGKQLQENLKEKMQNKLKDAKKNSF